MTIDITIFCCHRGKREKNSSESEPGVNCASQVKTSGVTEHATLAAHQLASISTGN
jgi:hypothetical protein